MKLTQKQEIFTQNLFEGMTQREAWIQAGYSSKYAPAIIDTNACNLANSNKIKIRLNELNSQVISPLIATEIERKEILSTISRTPLKQKEIKPRDSINAIQELNKMEKLYSDTNVTYNEIKVLIVRERPLLKEGSQDNTVNTTE